MNGEDNTGGKVPHKIQDRRLRALARPDPSDRRQYSRYRVDFPVEIIVGQGETEQVFTGTASDISDGGLRLENVELPGGEKRVKLRFKVPEAAMPEEFQNRQYELDAEIRRHDEAAGIAGVQFSESLSRRLARTTWTYLRWGAVIGCFLTISLILLIKYGNLYYFWFDVPIFLYSLTVGGYLVSRFLFAGFYRPPKPREDLPTVSVIIPTKNEEEHIERTIMQVMESRYPADKMEVVAINDGSTDATLAAMNRAREKYPELTIINFEESQGKRDGLVAGTRITTGEIVIFIDSDSFLETNAIRNLVDGFQDEEVAAVTGHCDVENAWDNMLTKMQAVRYYIGFRIMKGAESIFDSITCLSGPLSAYRRSTLEPFLEPWVKQTFLGSPATFGDDRSITNFLLKAGHKLKYDSRSRCTTIVPEDYRTFLRQQMRWKRSWFRESIRACGFFWRRQPLMSLSFYLGLILPVLSPAIVFRALIYVPFFHHGTPLIYLFGILLMSSLMSTSYLFARRSALWGYGVFFCYFYLLVLVWQLPWAVITFWTPEWGTREKKEAAA